MDKENIKKLKQQKLKDMLKKRRDPFRVVVDNDNVCIVRDESKCIRCGKCKDICESTGVFGSFDLDKSKTVCLGCGKCVGACPTGALVEVSAYREVLKEIDDYNKVLVVSVAPAVRVAIAEEFGFNAGLYDEGRLISALRMIGFDYVFDITFGADLTTTEEASEFVRRLTLKDKPLPQFTSCCPAWINYLEIYRPDLLQNVSSCKSPISMQGAIIKTHFAEQKKFKPENIVHITVAPCIAKKGEIKREKISGSAKYWNNPDLKDVDYILTTRELAHLIKNLNIPYGNLPEGRFDKLFSRGSGAGVIFGATGGVMEAVLREAYYQLNGEDAPEKFLNLEKVRGNTKIKEDVVNFGDFNVKVAVCNGINSAKELLEQIQKGEKEYDLVEVMTCEGGCVGGPGQPRIMPLTDELRQARANALYHTDKSSEIRCAHNNPEIKEVYSNFLGKPLSMKAKELLHTQFSDRSKEYIFKER